MSFLRIALGLVFLVIMDSVASVDIAAGGDVRLTMSTAELQQLANKYIPPLIVASGITQPNQII
jgi:hypothetical protein